MKTWTLLRQAGGLTAMLLNIGNVSAVTAAVRYGKDTSTFTLARGKFRVLRAGDFGAAK